MRVKDFQGKIGTTKGLIFKYGVQWMIVEYDDGGTALVMPDQLVQLSTGKPIYSSDKKELEFVKFFVILKMALAA